MFSALKSFDFSFLSKALTYIFEVRPYTPSSAIKIMAIIFAVMVVAGIGLKIYQQTQKLEKFQHKLLERYFSLLVTMGGVGILMTWLRFERVNLLSMRLLFVVWIIILLAWFYPILKYQFTVVPTAQKRAEERKLFQKYLPKKK